MAGIQLMNYSDFQKLNEDPYGIKSFMGGAKGALDLAGAAMQVSKGYNELQLDSANKAAVEDYQTKMDTHNAKAPFDPAKMGEAQGTQGMSLNNIPEDSTKFNYTKDMSGNQLPLDISKTGEKQTASVSPLSTKDAFLPVTEGVLSLNTPPNSSSQQSQTSSPATAPPPSPQDLAQTLPIETPLKTERMGEALISPKLQEDFAKAKLEHNIKGYQLGAELNNKLILNHMKYGDVKGAMELKNKYMTELFGLAQLDAKAASEAWNNSYLGDQFGKVSFTNKGEWESKADRNGNWFLTNTRTGERALSPPVPGQVIKTGDKSMGLVMPNGSVQEFGVSDKFAAHLKENSNGEWINFKEQKGTGDIVSVRKVYGADPMKVAEKTAGLVIKNQTIDENTQKKVDAAKKSLLQDFYALSGGSKDEKGKPIPIENIRPVLAKAYTKENPFLTHNDALKYMEKYTDEAARRDPSLTPEQLRESALQTWKQNAANLPVSQSGIDAKGMVARGEASVESQNGKTYLIKKDEQGSVIASMPYDVPTKAEKKKQKTQATVAASPAKGTFAQGAAPPAESGSQTRTPVQAGSIRVAMMSDGTSLNIKNTSPMVASRIATEISKQDKLVRQRAITPAQRDQYLKSFVSRYNQ